MAKKPSLKDRSVTAREAALAYENTKKFSLSQPDDVMPDPHYRVPVSRQGKDRGAILRDSEVVDVPDPTDGGAQLSISRVRGGLERMLSDGSISEGMYRAGKFFQSRFDECGYVHYSSVDLDRAGSGGSSGIEDHLHRTHRARKSVDKILRGVGYPDSQMGKAAFWIIGHGMGLDKMAQSKELHDFKGATDTRYWKAIVVATLQVMETFVVAVHGGRRSGKINGERYFMPDDIVVSGRVVLRDE